VAEAWSWLLASFAIFLFSDWLAGRRNGVAITGRLRALQAINSSLAVLLGIAVTLHLQPDSLAPFYFGAAGVMAVAAWAWWRERPAEPLVAVFVAKVVSLFALGVITEWSGHARYLVLLAQAFVLLVAARKSSLKTLRVLGLALWALALAFFGAWLLGTSQPPPASDLLAVGAFLAGSALLCGWHEQWLAANSGVKVVSGILLGLATIYAADAWSGTGWGPAFALAGAALLVAGGAVSGGWTAALIAAGLAVLSGHVAMTFYARAQFAPWQLWANEAVLLTTGLAAAVALDRNARGAESGFAPVAAFCRTLLATVAVVALQATWFHGLAPAPALVAAVGTALVLLAATPRARGWPMVSLATFAVALGWVGHGIYHVRSDDALWLGLAAVGAWVLPAWLVASAMRRESMADRGLRGSMPAIQAALATLLTLFALYDGAEDASRVALAAVSALAIAALAWRPGLTAALPAASAVLGAGLVWTLGLGRHGDSGAVLAAMLIAGVTATLPVLARRLVGEPGAAWRRYTVWAHPALAWVVLGAFLIQQRTGLASYATVLCAVAAIALFLLGLFARERPARLVGLAGLALCVPRAFLVDIDSTLYRIGAFVALGVVLLWVGFSYHRFRHFVTGEAPGRDAPEDKKL
jgi:uncharacterized membrane protein (UPF0136 family)